MRDALLRIARLAGDAILQSYRQPPADIAYKKDASPVTDADLRSHIILSGALGSVRDVPVLSEESLIPYAERKNWREFWSVDPLDGTRDFLDGSDEFAINLALIRDAEPVLGMIFSPVKNVVYFAERGKGAFVWRDDRWRALPIERCDEAIAIRSRHHDSPLVSEFCRLNRIEKTLTIGSSLKFGVLAEGRATVYPRYDGSKEWDIAAGHLILREAGGEMRSLPAVGPVTYNKPSVENPFFLAVSSQAAVTSFEIPKT